MSMLDDIMSERADLDAAVRSLANQLVDQGKSMVGYGEKVRPVVAAVTGGQTELFFPEWRSDWERGQMFSTINEQLADMDHLDATVCRYGGSFVLKHLATADDVRSDPSAMAAVIVQIRTGAWKEMQIYPYTETEEAVAWLQPTVVHDYPDTLVTQPCAD